MKCRVFFADERIKKAYDNLLTSSIEDKDLHKGITRAIKDIADNCFCGIQIPKRQMPKEYILKYGANNLWKYDLPKAWRLLYTIKNNEATIISIIIEWLNHKKYERRFRY